jgi:hypothetical protein
MTFGGPISPPSWFWLGATLIWLGATLGRPRAGDRRCTGRVEVAQSDCRLERRR